MYYKSVFLLALGSAVLFAQKPGLTPQNNSSGAPVIDEKHQNDILKLNNKILLLENQIQKAFGEQIKEIDALKQQLGQELASICGDKFQMQMEKDTAVCVAKQPTQAVTPTTQKPAAPTK